MWLSLNRDKLDPILSCIDKSFFKIMVTLGKTDMESLNFILKDSEIDKECRYMATLSIASIDEDLLAAETELDPSTLQSKFPLDFTLKSRQFKKTIC